MSESVDKNTKNASKTPENENEIKGENVDKDVTTQSSKENKSEQPQNQNIATQNKSESASAAISPESVIADAETNATNAKNATHAKTRYTTLKDTTDTIKGVVGQDGTRLWSALVMVVLLVIVLGINNGVLTWLVMGVLYLVAMYEGAFFYKVPINVCNSALAIVIWVLLYFSVDPLVVGILGVCIACVYVAFNNDSEGFKDIALFVYPSLPFIAIYALYGYGVWHLVWLIIVVAVADVFAYYGGKVIGKNVLSPISPKKTIEGAVCGIIAALIIGSITGIGIFGGFFTALISSICIAIVSIIGDLLESALKRRVGLKDSGTLIPGHGGLLDRIDAIMFGSVTMLFILSLLEMYQE